jgi:hypothetical protein
MFQPDTRGEPDEHRQVGRPDVIGADSGTIDTPVRRVSRRPYHVVDNDPVPGHPSTDGARWVLAEEVTSAIRRRWPAEVCAVGVYGSLAHGDDDQADDVDLVVLTHRPATGPRPGIRRIAGTVVDIGVVAADEYLGSAQLLSRSWPLAADRYLTTRPLYDPQGWHPRLRDAHLARLAEAGGAEFAALARDAWCQAETTYTKALRLAEWHDTTGALLTFAAARLETALVEGLLTRTYFRDGADAVRRTRLGDADLTEVGSRLRAQADELAGRGCPVDGTVADLVRDLAGPG